MPNEPVRAELPFEVVNIGTPRLTEPNSSRDHPYILCVMSALAKFKLTVKHSIALHRIKSKKSTDKEHF